MSSDMVGFVVHAFWVCMILAVPLSLLARATLVVLVALQLRIIATRGPGAVTWLGWLIMLLTLLAFRRTDSSHASSAVGTAAAAATGAAAGAYFGPHSAERWSGTDPRTNNRNGHIVTGNTID